MFGNISKSEDIDKRPLKELKNKISQLLIVMEGQL